MSSVESIQFFHLVVVHLSHPFDEKTEMVHSQGRVLLFGIAFLSYNSIGVEGAQAIGKALETNTSIQNLDIR